MIFLVSLLVGLFGLAANWFTRWAKGQTAAGFADYMRSHQRSTMASVTTLLGAIAAPFALGDVVLSTQTLAMAFMAGFTIDNILNKAPEES